MNNEQPVDLEQLNLIAEGNPADRLFLIETYLNATEEDLFHLQAAITIRDVATVHRLAHDCAEVSRAHGMVAIVPALHTLAAKTEEGLLDGAAADLAAARKEYARMQEFLRHLPPQQKAA